ncbi:MAG: cytochrome c3 family protein [Candidatus Omnitrophica bacterium]|nr:cytochrome c3 family protein [Candidatus Omnitrophota bacterium]
MKRLFVCFTLKFVLLVVLAAPAGAVELAHEFIGAKKCSLCHSKPAQGEQYAIWLQSKHAKAIESLGTPEAKEIAAKLGIENPQASGKCLKCHSTAYWFSEERVSEAIAVEEGISCESCHGAGKDYAKKSVMQNREGAVAQGLLIPDEATCQKCHNEEAPTFKSFDFKEKWEKIKHALPE